MDKDFIKEFAICMLIGVTVIILMILGLGTIGIMMDKWGWLNW